MTTYSTLTGLKTVDGSIKQWVNDGTIPSASIVSKAEAWIYQYLRVREMISLETGAIQTGDTTLSVSMLDLLEPISLRIIDDSSAPIRLLDQEHFESRTYFDSSTGPTSTQPTEAMIVGNVFQLNATSDATYSYRLVYFGKPAALSTSHETNFLTDRYPHMLEAACYYWAFSFKKDRGEADHWMSVAMGLIDKANDEAGLFTATYQMEKYWSQ